LLLSMTGYGEDRRQQNNRSIVTEIRTINGRYLKVSTRTGEGYASLEPKIDALVRKHLRRGSIQVTLRIEREASSDDFQINGSVVQSYYRQLELLRDGLDSSKSGQREPIAIESLLQLPGVVDESARSADTEGDWPTIEQSLTAALERLTEMRSTEGQAMSDDLSANCGVISTEVEKIASRAPEVVQAYQTRLTDKLNHLLDKHSVEVEPATIVREVGIFADRADISEEVVRLRSHLEQFDTIMKGEESAGRKLEFLTQEMFRETNTIGSKANDATIAGHVIEIKAAIERMREMIQNIE